MTSTVRKLPVKIKTIKLDKEWEGWEFTARTNVKIKVFSKVSSGDIDKMIEGMCSIIQSWNFVDEEGNDMPPPSEDTIGDLTVDLLTAISNAYVKELTDLPSV